MFVVAIGIELVVPDGSKNPDRALAQKVVYQACGGVLRRGMCWK
jgi:4-aminobutyrate aminotransferase-like enzyme